MSQFQTKKFKDLKSKWYGKLEKDGFVDIEHKEKDQLLRYDDSYFKAESDPVRFAAKQYYYEAASKFFWEHDFKDKKTRLIWQLHSEGKTYEQISTELKSANFKKSSPGTVYLIVKKLAKEMLKPNDK